MKIHRKPTLAENLREEDTPAGEKHRLSPATLPSGDGRGLTHFISDVHLRPAAPAVTARFLAYLQGDAVRADALFILGDLFEAWPGDDCLCAPGHFGQGIADALAALTQSGVAVSILHGNRDFLLGAAFERASGARLIPDPYLLTTPAGQWILSHGDLLCADDTGYQAIRKEVRSAAWREAFLARPLAEREALALLFRRQSEAAQRGNAPDDLPLHAVDDFLRQYPQAAVFIHGHTHRPLVRKHRVDGIIIERHALAAWNETGGEYLALGHERLTRHAV